MQRRVIIRDEDGAEIANGGLGNPKAKQVILGDGTIVPFGVVWLSRSAKSGDSAVWHDDADTVTNFPYPADLEGLL